jgi:hypothetical protein
MGRGRPQEVSCNTNTEENSNVVTPENLLDRREHVLKNPIGKLRPDRLKSPRSLDAVDAVVLHSMGFDWSQYDISIYDKVDCHFAVLRSGKVLHLHDISVYLNASAGFNRRGIAVEFEGNPISDRGVAYKEEKYGRHTPTLSQIFAGRGLVERLKKEIRSRTSFRTDSLRAPAAHARIAQDRRYGSTLASGQSLSWG